MKKWLIGLSVGLVALPALAQDMPTLGDLPVGEWTQIPVEGARCLYDTEYSFLVRPASEPTANLMIYFEGGGACWDGFTCGARGQFASQYFVDETEPDNLRAGFFDFDNEENPVRDYNTVFIPYCSGDVHSGSTPAVTLPVPPETGLPIEEVTVNFTGFENASAALAWAFANYTDPAQVFVTGCSAGGYGALFHAGNIMQNYADQRVVLLADASVGVTPRAWEGLELWNTYASLPDFIPAFENVTPQRYSTTFHMRELARAFPENIFAQYTTFLDQVQVAFYALQTGRMVDADNFAQIAPEWTRQMLSNIYSLEATARNFANFMPGGTVHCITPLDITYTYEVQGVRFVDWVKRLLDGDASLSPMCDPGTGECLASPQ